MTNTETIKNLPDLIQFWLQGQVNDCVAGHLSRIERLEDRIQTQDAQIKALDQAVRLYEPGPPTFGTDFDYSELLEQLCNHEDWDDAVGSVYGTDAFNEAVGEAMTNASSLEDAVKEIICDKVSFEVRVS
jgi:hypothetical protein